MTRPASADDAARILRPRAVQQFLGLSETTVWRLRRAGDFPPVVRLTRTAIGFRYGDLVSWQTARAGGATVVAP